MSTDELVDELVEHRRAKRKRHARAAEEERRQTHRGNRPAGRWIGESEAGDIVPSSAKDTSNRATRRDGTSTSVPEFYRRLAPQRVEDLVEQRRLVGEAYESLTGEPIPVAPSAGRRSG